MESLKEENSRLREQLKIQEKICQKLKNEKDRKEEALTKALEEVSRLKEELESSKAVMKRFREEKEKEIQQLRMMKQELELRVRVSEEDLPFLGAAGGVVTEAAGVERDAGTWTTTSRSETTLNAADMAQAFSEWEGVEDIVNLFKEETTGTYVYNATGQVSPIILRALATVKSAAKIGSVACPWMFSSGCFVADLNGFI